MESSLFQMIKKTTAENPNKIISAYKDNVAFAEGPVVEQFSPADHSTSDYFIIKDIKTVISLKAETHNFPTTVEPFNGASTVPEVKSATAWVAVKVHGPLQVQLSI